MSDGHCFISYSHADGLDFVTKLADELEGGHPFIKVWFEKREMVGSRDDWDDQLAKAIQSCKCILFVMSKDSTAGHSNCKDEWTWALKYKKPVICLWISKDAEDQFRLNSRQKIDFTINFDQGLAKLRKTIAHLDSPDGQLEELNHRLADANRDLRRTNETDKPRIQAEIEQLKSDIQTLEKVIADPEAAAEQTRKNIKSGLAREQKSEGDTKKEIFTKFINPPPGVAPSYFQDRNYETEQVAAFLNNTAQRLMTIIGRGGVGKTATICRLLKDLERGVLPDDLGEMQVDGIVYLSEVGGHKINFANIFYDLCKLLPADTVQKLDSVYKNPKGSTESKMQTLLDNFQGKPVILLLDNFETLIEEKEELPIRDAELDEALYSLLNGAHTAVKVIITTRIPPEALNGIQPGRQRVHHLESGLAPKYAKEMLLQMDKDGIYGFISADESVFDAIYKQTSGLPKALEALVQILASDRFTTLKDLLEMPVLPENVVEALVGEAFNRLDTNAQKVMQALAVYNRPVTPAAVDYLLAPHLPAMDSAPILQRLANMHFARKESGRFYLHPVDREFAFGLIPEKDLTTKDTKVTKEEEKASDIPDVSDVIKIKPDDVIPASETDEESLRKAKQAVEELKALFADMKAKETNYHLLFTKHDLVSRAADYFAQARKPRAEWKKLDDLSAQLAEFDLRCVAGDYDTAASVLTEIDFDYLLLWGHYRLMIELHEKLQGNINDWWQNSCATGNLGLALYETGQVQKAVGYYEKALAINRENKNRQGEGAWLGNLGTAYVALGDASKAIEFYENSLTIASEIGSRKDEGSALVGLGNAFQYLGNMYKAIDFYEKALVIDHEIGNQSGEGIDLSNIASQYSSLGNYEKAIDYYKQALQNAREIGNKYGESKRLNGLAGVLVEKGDLQNAITHSKESLRIGQEMSSPEVCIESSHTLATAFLFSKKFKEALHIVEESKKYDRPNYVFNISTLHGIILLHMRDTSAGSAQRLSGLTKSRPDGKGSDEDLSGLAEVAFLRAIGQADEILSKTAEYYDALDAKGLALCGLAICDLRLSGRGVPSMSTETNDSKPVTPDKVTVSAGRDAPTIDDAIETFRKARKIAPHAGVVKSVLRLFDELVKCDQDGVLKNVRAAVEGKE